MNYYQRTTMYIRILVFMLAMVVGVIIYEFDSYADEVTANNYEEFKTCVYNAMLNRQSSASIKYNGADYQNIIRKIRKDEILKEIQEIDNINTSDDGVYMMKAAYNGFYFNYNRNNNTYNFTFNFTWDENTTELNYVNNEINRIINETGVKNMNNAYDRAVALRDYITNNIQYGKGTKNTPYVTLTTKQATCHSYALLYYKLLTAADVKCYYVTGNVKDGWHAWNIVQIGDKWYNIDVTYESTHKDGSYSFKGKTNFSTTHVLDAEYNTSTFLSKYNISQTDFDRNGYVGNDLVIKTATPNNNQCVSKDKDASVVLDNQQNNSKSESTSIENNTNCTKQVESSTDCKKNVENTPKVDETKKESVSYDNSPKTGDVTPLTVCIILGLVSMTLCIGVVIIKKKSR